MCTGLRNQNIYDIYYLTFILPKKSVHFSLLRHAIPGDSPVAVAFAFNLWLEFMDQTLDNGRTLREEIDLRLAPFSYPPDMQALGVALDGARDLIKDTDETSFSPAAESAVLACLRRPRRGRDDDRLAFGHRG